MSETHQHPEHSALILPIPPEAEAKFLDDLATAESIEGANAVMRRLNGIKESKGKFELKDVKDEKAGAFLDVYKNLCRLIDPFRFLAAYANRKEAWLFMKDHVEKGVFKEKRNERGEVDFKAVDPENEEANYILFAYHKSFSRNQLLAQERKRAKKILRAGGATK